MIKGMLLHLNVVCTVLRQVQLGLMATVDDAILMTLCLSLLRLALLIVFRCPVTDESNVNVKIKRKFPASTFLDFQF